MSVQGSRSRTVGDYTVTAFSDGYFQTSLDVMSGDKEMMQTVSGKALDEPIRIPLNAFLVEGRGVRALVDAGSGVTLGPSAGALPENLRAAGVELDGITHVLLTHIHPDHSNGLIDAEGQPWFPKAELVVNEVEIAYWNDREPSQEPHDRIRRNMINTRKALAPYASRTTRIGDGEFLHGIHAMVSPGHTPGHTTWTIEGGKDSLMIWGDTVHMAFIQLKRPEVTWGYDSDPVLAVSSRLRLLDQVSADRTRIAGMHLDFPGYGIVKKEAQGYAVEAG